MYKVIVIKDNDILLFAAVMAIYNESLYSLCARLYRLLRISKLYQSSIPSSVPLQILDVNKIFSEAVPVSMPMAVDK